MQHPSLGRRWAGLALVGALALSCAGYGNSLRGAFVFDDLPLLVDGDCHRRGLASIPALFDPRRKDLCGARPVRMASYTLDHALWGDEVLGYHLHNVVLHALVTWAALLLLVRLTGDRRLALIAAGLFALHPIGTETVAYISGRRDLAMALFCLLGALAYLAYRDRERGGAWRLALVLLCPLLAMLSHESAAVLPGALVVLEVALRLKAREGLAAALRALARPRQLLPLGLLFGLALAFSAWMVTARNHSERAALWGPDVGGHLGTVLRMHAHYLRQLVLPDNLIADYSPDAFRLSQSLAEPAALGALALVLGLIAGALLLLPRRPLAAAAVLCYFGLLLPTSQLVVHHELMAEHRLYLPALCFCALFAAALTALIRRSRYAWGLVGVAALSYLVLTATRNRVWRTPKALWSTTVAQVPRCARAHVNLGAILAREGRLARARAHMQTALQIRPDLCDVRLNLGQLLADTGEAERGLAMMEQGARCRPKPTSLRQLGNAALRAGRLGLAERAFRQCLERYPGDARAVVGLGMVRHQRGDIAGALRRYGEASDKLASWPRLAFLEAVALADGCRLDQAARAAERFERLGGGARALARLQGLLRHRRRTCKTR